MKKAVTGCMALLIGLSVSHASVGLAEDLGEGKMQETSSIKQTTTKESENKELSVNAFTKQLLLVFQDTNSALAGKEGEGQNKLTDLVKTYNLPFQSEQQAMITRGQAAVLIASAYGYHFDVSEAISFLYENGISSGRFGQTIEGYEHQEPLTAKDATALLHNLMNKMETSQFKKRSTNQSYINYAKYMKSKQSEKLYNKLDIMNYIHSKNGNFAFLYMNLLNGEKLSYQENKVFAAASTIKLPLALYVYELASQGKINLEERLTYRSYHYYGGSGVIQHQKVGTTYTIRELVEKAMKHSDNIAFIMLKERVGRANFTQYVRDMGASHAYANGRNITTAKELALYAKAVYDFSQENDTYGKELIDYLTHTDYQKTIPAGVKNTPTAHKVGYIPMYLLYHDIGIVFDGDTPYIVAVLSKGVPYSQEEATIAEVTKLIHTQHEQNRIARPIPIDRSITLTRATNMYSLPNQDYETVATISPQVVQATERYKNWYKINTWMGSQWIHF